MYIGQYLAGCWNLNSSKVTTMQCALVQWTLTYSIEEGWIMELEDKAKVVTSVWGSEFVQFLAAPAVLPWSIRKKR